VLRAPKLAMLKYGDLNKSNFRLSTLIKNTKIPDKQKIKEKSEIGLSKLEYVFFAYRVFPSSGI